MDEDLRKIEKTIRNFKLIVNGTDQLSGGFMEPLKSANEPLERIRAIQRTLEKFQITGGLGVNVEGSIHKGYSVTIDKRTICGEQTVTPIPPATGACCFEDGNCIITSDSTCVSLGGTYQGDNTVCEPNPCGGACCNGSICSFTSESTCTSGGGTFQGVGTECTPNPCPTQCSCGFSPPGIVDCEFPFTNHGCSDFYHFTGCFSSFGLCADSGGIPVDCNNLYLTKVTTITGRTPPPGGCTMDCATSGTITTTCTINDDCSFSCVGEGDITVVDPENCSVAFCECRDSHVPCCGEHVGACIGGDVCIPSVSYPMEGSITVSDQCFP